MASKGSYFATRRLYYALSKLSKDALLDIVVDRAGAEIGEEASDETYAELIQKWIEPVAIVRRDKPVYLAKEMASLDKSDEDFRNKTGKYTQVDGRRQEPAVPQITPNDPSNTKHL